MMGEIIDGRYEVKGLVSRGRNTTLYRAIEQVSGEPVTLQFFDHLADSTRHTLPKSLKETFDALTRLVHPGLLVPYEYGVHQGVPFLIMPVVQGNPLSDETAVAPLAMERVIHISREIGELLAYLHGNGVVHGHLNPTTVRLTPTHDFPLVQLIGLGPTPTQAVELDEAERPYLAPEQIAGQAADVKTDLYSLGVILHELATGQLPGTLLALRPLNIMIPPSLEQLILELLNPDPAQRPAHAEQVVRRLEQIGQHDLFPPGVPPLATDDSDVPGPPSWA
jgi:serine/threonine protein kinase